MLPNVERREIPLSIGHMLLSCAAGSSLMCSRGLLPGQSTVHPSRSVGPLVGESADLCWRDAEVVFEVSGELVRAEVAVRGDDVLDGYRG